jgi:hypothetical protein
MDGRGSADRQNHRNLHFAAGFGTRSPTRKEEDKKSSSDPRRLGKLVRCLPALHVGTSASPGRLIDRPWSVLYGADGGMSAQLRAHGRLGFGPRAE